MSKIITVSEAGERFSEVFRQVVEGEIYIVTSPGQPAVRIERLKPEAVESEKHITRLRNPAGQEIPPITPQELANDSTRERNHHEFMRYLRSLPVLNIGPWTRDELYDDNLELGE